MTRNRRKGKEVEAGRGDLVTSHFVAVSSFQHSQLSRTKRLLSTESSSATRLPNTTRPINYTTTISSSIFSSVGSFFLVSVAYFPTPNKRKVSPPQHTHTHTHTLSLSLHSFLTIQILALNQGKRAQEKTINHQPSTRPSFFCTTISLLGTAVVQPRRDFNWQLMSEG